MVDIRPPYRILFAQNGDGWSRKKEEQDWRDEHFIASTVFQSKYPIYLYFFGSVRKMSQS
jgi:hypothetical protein